MKKSGKNSKKNTVKTILTMIVLGCLIVGAYAYLANRDNSGKTENAVEKSEIEKILSKDLTKEYPPTPREVLKLYGRAVQAMHGEEITREESDGIGRFLRNLYDEELLANNSEKDYLATLWQEVTEYQEASRTVTGYAVENASDIVYFTDDKKECARVCATFTLHDGEVYNKTAEEFIVRKDSDGHWKIVGWRLMDGKDY